MSALVRLAEAVTGQRIIKPQPPGHIYSRYVTGLISGGQSTPVSSLNYDR